MNRVGEESHDCVLWQFGRLARALERKPLSMDISRGGDVLQVARQKTSQATVLRAATEVVGKSRSVWSEFARPL
jgi:hypothetical protein